MTAHVEDLAGVELGALGDVEVGSSHAGKDVSESLAQVYGAVSSLRIRELEIAVRLFGDILLVLIGFFQTIDITVLSVKVPWPALFVDAYAWCANFNIPFSIPSPGIYEPLMTYAFKCMAMLMFMWAFLVLWTIRDYDKAIRSSDEPEKGLFSSGSWEDPMGFAIASTVLGGIPLLVILPLRLLVDSEGESVAIAMWAVGGLGFACCACMVCENGKDVPWPDIGDIKDCDIFMLIRISLYSVIAILPLNVGWASGILELSTVKLALGGLCLLAPLFCIICCIAQVCRTIHAPRKIPSDIPVAEVAVWKARPTLCYTPKNDRLVSAYRGDGLMNGGIAAGATRQVNTFVCVH